MLGSNQVSRSESKVYLKKEKKKKGASVKFTVVGRDMAKFVTLRESCTIQPAYPTWTGRFKLTELDQVGSMTHVPTIYFYKKPSELFKGNVVGTLKNSLSHTLFHFYPLAGRVHWLPRGRLELECNAAGVKFIEAESKAELSSFNDFSLLPEYENLFPQVNYKNPIETIPLLLVQLTKFKCGGVSLSINISHLIVDGQSAFHFKLEWGRIARGEPLETVPFLDRKILWAGEPLPPFSSPAQFDYKEFNHMPCLKGETTNVEERKKETILVRLKLSKSQIEKLRSKATASEYADPARRFTLYETVAGHVWRCACIARGHSPEQPTALGICIDIRRRIQPPLPRGYFGNAIVDVLATSTSGELISKELGFAAKKIREAIKNVTSEYVMIWLKYLKSQEDLKKFQDLDAFGNTEGPYYGNPNLALVSWLTLPLLGLDFGWGKEIYMGSSGAPEFDGDSLILPDQNEDGSVVIDKSLQVAHMKEFERHFYEDI